MSSIAGRHDLHAQTMLFEQVAKPQNGRFIRQAAGARVKVRELAIQRHIVQRLFHSRITQSKPLLQEMNAQHGFNCKWRASAFGCVFH